jgi:hypothetical protein
LQSLDVAIAIVDERLGRHGEIAATTFIVRRRVRSLYGQ